MTRRWPEGTPSAVYNVAILVGCGLVAIQCAVSFIDFIDSGRLWVPFREANHPVAFVLVYAVEPVATVIAAIILAVIGIIAIGGIILAVTGLAKNMQSE